MNGSKTIGFLFDLDGVLIDSEPEYTRIWSEIEMCFPTGIDNFAIKIKGQTLPEILNSNFARHLHDDIIDMLNEKEQQMHYDWLPGARETLDKLREMAFGAVLVTSSNNMKMRHLREERPELEDFFTDIVTADRISRSKPDPEGYLLGAEILNVPAARCAVFEDSRQGVKAGKASGAYVVGLTTTLKREDIESQCDRIIENLTKIDIEELAKILYKR